jgi:AcrR family transcriptional regulator
MRRIAGYDIVIFMMVEQQGDLNRDNRPPEILDSKPLTDASQARAISSSVRLRILYEALEPVTVRELAERFEVPRTRLYYHVNRLVKEGLLIQVDERMSGARVERIYRAVARMFRTGPQLFESVADLGEAAKLAAGLILDPARSESETLLEKRLQGESTIGDVRRMLVRLSEDQAKEFELRLTRVCSDLGEFEDSSSPDSERTSYGFSFVFAPAGLRDEP